MCWFFPSKKGFCNVKIGFSPNVSLNHTMKHFFAGMAIVKPHKFSGFLKMNYKIANKSTCLTRNWYWASCNDAATPFFTLRYLPKRAIFRIISAVAKNLIYYLVFPMISIQLNSWNMHTFHLILLYMYWPFLFRTSKLYLTAPPCLLSRYLKENKLYFVR